MTTLPPLIPIGGGTTPKVFENRQPAERVGSHQQTTATARHRDLPNAFNPLRVPLEEEDLSLVDGVLVGHAELPLAPFFGVPMPPGLEGTEKKQTGVIASRLLDIVPIGSELEMAGLETVSLKELQPQGGSGSAMATALFESPKKGNVTEGEGDQLLSNELEVNVLASSSDRRNPSATSEPAGETPTKAKMTPLLGKLKASLYRLDESGTRVEDPDYQGVLRVGGTVQFEVQLDCIAVGSNHTVEEGEDPLAPPAFHFAVRYCCSAPSALNHEYVVAVANKVRSGEAKATSLGVELNSTEMLDVRSFAPTPPGLAAKSSHIQRVVLAVDNDNTLAWLHSGKLQFQVWRTQEENQVQSIEDILGMC